MSDPFAALRDSLAAARKRQRLYPPQLRDQALALAQAHGASFRSCTQLAKRLGLPPATLRCWLKTPADEGTFLPVVVRSAPSHATSLSLVLPGGARVEGLSLDDLASLCRKVAS